MKHILQGLGDFLKRYASVTHALWAERKSMESPQRTPDEIAFLPAHLEIVETPTSPSARWTMRLIITLFTLAVLWAIFGQVDIVAVAPGKTITQGRTKVIQPAETAVIKRILVQDGQTVKAGDLLIELDATSTGAEANQASDALTAAQLAEQRYLALQHALKTKATPTLAALDGIPNTQQQAEQTLAESQYLAFQAKKQNLDASINQRKAETQTIQAMLKPMSDAAHIARKKEKDYAQLIKKDFVGKHDYLTIQEQRINAERDLAAQRNRLQEVRSALSAAQEERRVLITDTEQKILEGLREAREQITQLGSEVAKTNQRDAWMQLRAPVDGTVQQLAMHTVGGVVTPAQALLAIVPADEALEVEASILNKDIGFVKVGQPVTVKVESFPYTRYGYLHGTVTSVSLDAAQDEQMGLIFPARIKLDQSTLNIDGVTIRLTSGMALSAEIKTGKRRLISYLLSPLQVHTTEAMRER